ncbi:hypothetical protein [Streptomyces griseorubiginosus]|uniref:Immunity protein Imm1 n=1 Tax=Streptomyces griseorubiginosus TaxID=67304 RepID=A0AAI8L681_9ACTN|nr:hypothetical protein [Streptomyces griseorubiginosus]AYC42137.1 hypothetical protein DWG14_06429 [Streptomyces griseorubiginosus]
MRGSHERVGRTAETWWLDGDSAPPLSAAEALDLLRGRIAAGLLETWLGSSEGRALALVTNTERAHVTLLDDEDDPGQHVVDPGARGSGGYVLANGQWDEYPDEHTVPLAHALRVVAGVVEAGVPPPDVPWSVER